MLIIIIDFKIKDNNLKINIAIVTMKEILKKEKIKKIIIRIIFKSQDQIL